MCVGRLYRYLLYLYHGIPKYQYKAAQVPTELPLVEVHLQQQSVLPTVPTYYHIYSSSHSSSRDNTRADLRAPKYQVINPVSTITLLMEDCTGVETTSKHEISRGDNDRRRIRRKYTDPTTDLATTNPKAPHLAPTNTVRQTHQEVPK